MLLWLLELCSRDALTPNPSSQCILADGLTLPGGHCSVDSSGQKCQHPWGRHWRGSQHTPTFASHCDYPGEKMFLHDTSRTTLLYSPALAKGELSQDNVNFIYKCDWISKRMERSVWITSSLCVFTVEACVCVWCVMQQKNSRAAVSITAPIRRMLDQVRCDLLSPKMRLPFEMKQNNAGRAKHQKIRIKIRVIRPTDWRAIKAAFTPNRTLRQKRITSHSFSVGPPVTFAVDTTLLTFVIKSYLVWLQPYCLTA